MEYTELADYDLPAGRLTAWEPVSDAAQWRTDSRRLSYMHAEHALRAASLGDGWRSHWIGTAFFIEEAMEPDAVAGAIRQWYRRHEAFRSSVTIDSQRAPEDDLLRVTLPAQAVDVRGRAMGQPTSGSEARQAIQDYFDGTVSPLRWPHCLAVTVEPDDRNDRFLLIFAADHTVMDAYTQVFAISELTALYRAEVSGEPHGLPEYGSYLDYSDAERHLGEQIDANNAAVFGWRGFFDTSPLETQPDPMPRFPRMGGIPDGIREGFTAPREPDEGMQVSASTYLLDASETARFNEICKSAGANMTVGVYTALSMAAAELSGTGELRFISPVHTRTGPEWGEAVGWFVGLIPVHVDPSDARTFLEALPHVASSAARYRGVGSAPFAPIADLIGGDTTPPGFVVSYIDLRRAQGAAEWESRQARVLRSATENADEVYFWINRIPDGVNISTRYPARGQRRSDVEAFLAVFAAVLREVVEHGDRRYLFSSRVASETGAGLIK